MQTPRVECGAHLEAGGTPGVFLQKKSRQQLPAPRENLGQPLSRGSGSGRKQRMPRAMEGHGIRRRLEVPSCPHGSGHMSPRGLRPQRRSRGLKQPTDVCWALDASGLAGKEAELVEISQVPEARGAQRNSGPEICDKFLGAQRGCPRSRGTGTVQDTQAVPRTRPGSFLRPHWLQVPPGPTAGSSLG